MIGYVMVGTNNLPASTEFYDIILEPLDLVRVYTEDDMVAYASKSQPEEIEFYVCKPFNRDPATFGNGSMVAFAVHSRDVVERFHKVALENGAKNEGFPGPRPTENDPCYAYVRDIDGNKICVFC